MRWCTLGFCLLLLVSRALGEDATAATELAERLLALERIEAVDASVKRPLELARTALAQADARAKRGDEPGAERARAVARAAVELAGARLDLLRERALLKAARARREQALSAKQTAERALARERQRAAELERAIAQP